MAQTCTTSDDRIWSAHCSSCTGEDSGNCCRSDHDVSFIPRSDSEELGGPRDISRRNTPSRLSILEARFTLSDAIEPNNRPACPLHGAREVPQHPSTDLLPRPLRELVGTPSRRRHRSRSPLPYAQPEWEAAKASALSATGVDNKIRCAVDAVRPPLGSPRYGWVEPGKGWTRCPSAGRSRQRSVQRCFCRSSHGNARGPSQYLQEEGLWNHYNSKQPTVGVGDYRGCPVYGKGVGSLDTTELVLGFDGHQRNHGGRVIPNDRGDDSGWAMAYLAGEDEFLPRKQCHPTTPTWSTHAYAGRSRDICEGVILASNSTRLVETHRMKEELGHARNHTQELIKTNNALARKVIALRKKVEWLGRTSLGMDPTFRGDQTDKDKHLQQVTAPTACREGMGQVKVTSRQALPWRAPELSVNSTRCPRAAWSKCTVQRAHALQATANRRQGTYHYIPLVERAMGVHTSRARPRQEAHAMTQTDADLLEKSDWKAATKSANSQSTNVNYNFRRCEQKFRGLKHDEGASNASDRHTSSSFAPRGQPVDPTAVPEDRLIPTRASPEREGKSGNFSLKGEKQTRHGSLANGSRTTQREPCRHHVSHPEETRPAATQMTSAAPNSGEAFHAEQARAIGNYTTAPPCVARDDAYCARQRNQDGLIEDHEVTANFADAAVVSSEDAAVGAPSKSGPVLDVRGEEKNAEDNAVDERTIQQSVRSVRKGEMKALSTRDTREHSTLDNEDTQSMSLIREKGESENLFERSTRDPREGGVSGWTSPTKKTYDKNSGTSPVGGGRADTTLGTNLLCERDQVQDLRVDFHRTRCTLAAIKAAASLATTRSDGNSPTPTRVQAVQGGAALAFKRWRELALETEGKASTDQSREAVRSSIICGIRIPSEPVDSLNSDSKASEHNSRVHVTCGHTQEEEVVGRRGHISFQSYTGGVDNNDAMSLNTAGGRSWRLSPDGVDVLSLSMAVSRAQAIEAVRCAVRRQQSQLLPAGTNASAGCSAGEPKRECDQAVSTSSGHLPKREILLYRRTEQAHTSERLKRTSRSKHGGSEDAGNLSEDYDDMRTDPSSSDGDNVSRRGQTTASPPQQPSRRRESTVDYTRAAFTATCPIRAVGANAWENESRGLLHQDQHGSGHVVRPLQTGEVNALRHLPPNCAATWPESVLSDHDTQNEASLVATRASGYESATEGRKTANDRTDRQPGGSVEESAEAEVKAILRHSEDEDDTYRRECAVLAGTAKAVFALAALEYRRVSARFYRWKRVRKYSNKSTNPTDRFKGSMRGGRAVGGFAKVRGGRVGRHCVRTNLSKGVVRLVGTVY